MNNRQIRLVNELEKNLPIIERLESFMIDVAMQIKEINAKIDRINANPGRKGPVPGMADIKSRLKAIEDALEIND